MHAWFAHIQCSVRPLTAADVVSAVSHQQFWHLLLVRNLRERFNRVSAWCHTDGCQESLIDRMFWQIEDGGRKIKKRHQTEEGRQISCKYLSDFSAVSHLDSPHLSFLIGDNTGLISNGKNKSLWRNRANLWQRNNSGGQLFKNTAARRRRRLFFLKDYPKTTSASSPSQTFPASPPCLPPHRRVCVHPDTYHLSRLSHLTASLSNNKLIFSVRSYQAGGELGGRGRGRGCGPSTRLNPGDLDY